MCLYGHNRLIEVSFAYWSFRYLLWGKSFSFAYFLLILCILVNILLTNFKLLVMDYSQYLVQVMIQISHFTLCSCTVPSTYSYSLIRHYFREMWDFRNDSCTLLRACRHTKPPSIEDCHSPYMVPDHVLLPWARAWVSSG